MSEPVKILLQTTIPYASDDWNIGRFSLLADHLRSLGDGQDSPLYEVTTRDHEPDAAGSDPFLMNLAESDIDEIWLFGVDAGNGLTKSECGAITKFRQRGGGIFSARDHNDLGSSLCTLGGVGPAHYFHNTNPDPDPDRNRRDDVITTSIDYPNYHSGANGDYQKVTSLVEHELLKRPDGRLIEYFPAHPHEGGIGAPMNDESARVIATGMSQVTGRPFNLIVAFERHTDAHSNHLGRAIADSSFHHFVDYNWNISKGCPSFLEEPPGSEVASDPARLDDVKTYVANVARWLVSD